MVRSLHGGPIDSPHDKLCRLLMFIATLKDHGAARVTAVVPYLAYARKDQQTKPHDPVNLRYVAQLFDAVGVAQLIVLEAHNVAAFQNAFRCPTVHLSTHPLFGELAPEIAATGPLAVASPDPGGVKRVLLWREALEERIGRPVNFAMIDKRRSAGVLSGGQLVAGEVKGATVLLLDDLIASGATLQRSATALRRAGAKDVIGCAPMACSSTTHRSCLRTKACRDWSSPTACRRSGCPMMARFAASSMSCRRRRCLPKRSAPAMAPGAGEPLNHKPRKPRQPPKTPQRLRCACCASSPSSASPACCR